MDDTAAGGAVEASTTAAMNAKTDATGTPVPSVVRNVVANFVGRAWSASVTLLFVPVYIRFLGVDAYGLIGIYTSIMALLGVLDLGLSATLARQLARLSASAGVGGQEARDLVRTMEPIYWAIGLAIGAVIAALSGAVAHHWIQSDRMGPETSRHAFMIMACVAACEWPAALYSGALMGLQRQVLLNVIKGGFATLQAFGAILILWLVSPSVLAYFAWQGTVMLVQAYVLSVSVRRSLPPAARPAAFDRGLLHKNFAFAAGMTGFAFLATVLGQMDKIVLSKVLTLEAFGYYTLAFNLANAVSMLVQPIFVAVFPRLSQLSTAKDDRAETTLYHRACQLIAVVVIPIAMTVIFFSRDILLLWTRSLATADRAYSLLTVLMIGSALNALVTMPMALQLAHGWTRLGVVKNVIAVAICIPLLLWAVDRNGAMGAAIVWVALNTGYFLLEVPYMHRRLLTHELRRWYVTDSFFPMAFAFATCGMSALLLPSDAGEPFTFAWVVATWAVAAMGVAFRFGLLSPGALRGYVRGVLGG